MHKFPTNFNNICFFCIFHGKPNMRKSFFLTFYFFPLGTKYSLKDLLRC